LVVSDVGKKARGALEKTRDAILGYVYETFNTRNGMVAHLTRCDCKGFLKSAVYPL
jgi:hypothetical protein